MVAPGCKKDSAEKDGDPSAGKATPPAQPAPADPTPAGPTAAQTLERFKGCAASVNARDTAAIEACYAAKDSELSVLDASDDAQAAGPAAIVGFYKQSFDGTTESKATPQLTLVGPGWVAAIVLDQATTRAGKKLSLLVAELSWFDEALAITRDLRLVDEQTIAAQAGVATNPMSPPVEEPWAKPVVAAVVPADKSRIETNVQIVANVQQAIADGSAETIAAHIADDVKFRYVPHKAVIEGKQAYVDSIAKLARMFSKMERNQLGSLGAGDWVVVHSLVTATPAADLPDAPGSAGKPVTTHQIEFYRLSDSAIAEHWVFENSAQWAAQLGVNRGGDAKP